MKKGIFSLMMGLLLAFTGLTNAQNVVEIGTGTTTTSAGAFNSIWGYTFAETLYPASEIGMAGTITHLAYHINSTASYHNEVVFYMKNVSTTAFNSASDVVPVTTADIVYQGAFDFPATSGWYTIELDTPFEYDGVSTLMIACDENAPGYSSRDFYYTNVPNCRFSYYSDSANPDPYNLGAFTGNSGTGYYRSNIQLTITSGGAAPVVLTLDPDPVDFGARPNNCWMRPMVATLTNEGPQVGIYGVDVDNDYFVPSLDEEMAIPFTLARNESVELNLGWTSAPEGQVDGLLVVDGQAREAFLFDITAYAYEPVEPDVWEMARVVTSYPYRDTPTTVALYNNYVLPPTDVEDGNDAVYKVTFDHDVMLNGNVVTVGGIEKAENGKMAIYTRAGIDEVGGPDLNNNYTGPTVSSSEPMTMTAYPEGLDGTTTVGTLPMYGLYADAYTRSQYVIPATEIAQMAGCPINSLTYYTESNPTPWQSNFQVYLTEVNYTTVSSLIDPATATTVYTGQLVIADGMMHIDFATPYQYNGGNLLIGMDCLECNNYSSCYFKCVAMTGAGMYAYNYSAPTFTSPYVVNYAPTTTFGYMGRSRNRETNTLTVADGTATDNRVPVYGYNADTDLCAQYIIPAGDLTDMNGGQINSLTYYASSAPGSAWNGTFTVYMAEVSETAPTSLVNRSSCTTVYTGSLNATSGTMTINLSTPYTYNGGNLLIGFDQNTGANWSSVMWMGTDPGYAASMYGYGWGELSYGENWDGSLYFIPKTTFTYEAATPGPTPVPGDQLITNMTMLPGTYYIAASSTADAWDVILNASELPCPDEITAEANCVEPADNSDGIDPSSVTLKWHLSPYTTEYRLLFGSTYYCENVLVDWTRDLADSYTVTGLFNNTNYFWRIEERNDGCPQGVVGPVWGFTTTFNAPTNLHATNANGNNIYENETLHLAWTPIVDRTFRMYNIYQNGELIGQTPSNPDPNATTTFDVEGLEYNMGGYVFNVTALYDEGESFFSNDLIIAVSGEGSVEGYVYEQDGVTGIAGATVTITNVDEFGRLHTYTFTTDANGYYTGVVLAGECGAVATCAGYQDEAYENNPFQIVYNELTPDINFIMDEVFAPVSQVWAEYYPDPEDPESPYVKVYWGFAPSTMIEDFETGDFSRYEWNIPAQYPFEITTTNPYEGAYCMQSTNYNVASSTSSIDVTVEIPRDGLMSFYKRISCESSWDMAYFYMDGVQMATFTGTSGWGVKEVAVTEGTHNFKWEYTKDGSVNSGEDRFFIDYIDFIHDAQPVGPGWHTYLEGEFDNAYTSNVGTPSWGYEYPASVISSYAGMTMTKVALFSDDMYGAVGGTFTCNVYQGGATPAAGTLVSSITVDVPAGVGDWVEFDLTTPVSVNNDPLYVLWTADVIGGLGYPAGCATHTSAYGDWWNPGDGTGWSHMGECTWTMKNYFSDRSGRGFWASSADANQAIKPVSNLDSHLRTYAKGEEVSNGASCINPNATFKASANANDRSLLYYRVYRTDCYNDGPYTSENTQVLCCELHDTLYIDVEWPELPAGVYKWGVGCVYGGNRESEITWANLATPAVSAGVKVTRDGDMVYDFENGLQGWNVLDVNAAGGTWLHSDDNLQGQDYSVVAHSGTGFALCYSFVDYVGAYDTDSYMYSPQKYGITENSTLTFWADNANDSYPENFSVCIATADNPTASDFTEIWNGGAKANNGAKAEVRHDGNRYDNWRQHTIDLSAYAGQNIYIAFHDVNYDAYEIWIDDVTITATGTPGPTPDPDPSEIQEPRESPIVWSNCLDKDMYLNGAVDITVLLNSADSPEGTTVSFRNLNEFEQELYPVAPVVLDSTGYYVWDSFRRGEYEINVAMNGYESITEEVSIQNATSLRYVLVEILYGIDDLYVSHTGWAMWAGQDGPTPVPPHGDEFTFGFEEDPIANGWTIQQLNETSWVRQEGATGFGAAPHEGNYHMWLHWAYGDQDEWLITPEFTVPANGNLNFWTYATLGSTYGDHYYAKITVDGGNTWNVLWDATAQPAGTNYYTSPINCDLSAYAGQTAKIAWQGVMADGLWYAWCIDDITVSGGREVISFDGRQWFRQETNTTEVGEPVAYSKAGDVEPRNGERHLEGYKVLCTSIDGEPIFSGNTVHPFCQVDTDELVEGENYICKVAAIYSTGMSDWTEAIWQYKSCENYGEAQDVAAEGQTVTWNYPAGPVPPPPGPGDEFSFSFDSNADGWTTINADGDDHNWYHSSQADAHSTLAITSHTGAGHMMSESYCNATWAALTPDEYFVTPQMYNIAAGSTFSFWACAQDENYAAEHFGVAISTTGNTNAADFTTINEWTLTAKGNGKANPAATRNGKGNREGNWYQYTCDLSAYAGQQVWIAIRHFNCTDQFIMCMDDAQLTAGAKGNRDEYIQYCTESYDGAVGTGGGQVWWANMYPATSLAAYVGQNITKVGQWVSGPDEYGNIYDGTYNVEVYVGGSATAPGTLVASASQYITGDNDWHDIELNTPVAIDGTQNIWVIFNANGIGYPMCGCAYVGEPNSDLLSLDGSTWEHALDYSLPYTWMIRAFVTGGSPVPPEPTGNVLGAMIFRDGEWIAEVAYPTNEYTDEEGSGNYCVRIIYNGTAVLPDQNEYYSMSCPVCTESDDCAAGADIYGEYVWNNANDYGALITWGGAPVPPPGPGDEFTEGFESGSIPTGWTTIDADGDNHNWTPASVLMAGYLIPFHGGADCITSQSYDGNTGAALHPDNYLVSPQVAITNGSTFSFWACAQDPSYAAEHYGVAISTTGNTNAADFTTIAEWTMTAKDAAEAGAYMSKNGKGTREGTWYQKTVDLSDYAGQQIYIAIRHFNCTDMFYLNVDDAELSVGAKASLATAVKYNVYRSTDNVNYTFIGEVPVVPGQTEYSYFDNEVAAGTYYYQVRADYGDCESEPAKSGVNPSDNFVIVNVTSVAENGEIALYPNPTNGNITIQAQNMNRITVVSVLGQVVYDVEVEGDSQIINMAQFNAGVYMVRIATENGVSTQRVTVVK